MAGLGSAPLEKAALRCCKGKSTGFAAQVGPQGFRLHEEHTNNDNKEKDGAQPPKAIYWLLMAIRLLGITISAKTSQGGLNHQSLC